MQILQNVPLGLYSSMRLGGKASFAVDVHDQEELSEALLWADQNNHPVIVIGNGTNIVWRDEGFKGLLIVNKITGYETVAKDEKNVFLRVGAGEGWDSVVKRTTEYNLSGIESLSLIPGTAGATPIQNVGAYGQEVSQTLVSVDAYDNKEKKFVTIPASECGFGYRTSRFKTTDRNRFFIIGLEFHLTKTIVQLPLYAALQSYFDENQIKDYSPRSIRKAVINIRTSKLPDVSKVANNGSFFANPIIDEPKLKQLLVKFPDIVNWPQPNGKIKLSAAWLVENAGFKDIHDKETGMATWPSQAIVIINEHAKNTADLLKFKDKIVNEVVKLYEIKLEQEPELLP